MKRGDQITAIVGLGNPGQEYVLTRHNVGFQVVDRFAQAANIALQQRKFRASWGTGNFDGRRIVLVKPLTYMNRSGEAVIEVMNYFSIPADEMLVVHDDLDLPLGRIRMVLRSGAGGHRGVLSIIQHLHSDDFPRLKLGIGRPLHGESVESYVLHAPYPEQVPTFADMVAHAFDAARMAFSTGLVAAMNQFNRQQP